MQQPPQTDQRGKEHKPKRLVAAKGEKLPRPPRLGGLLLKIGLYPALGHACYSAASRREPNARIAMRSESVQGAESLAFCLVQS